MVVTMPVTPCISPEPVQLLDVNIAAVELVWISRSMRTGS